jgi:hypothetical protein
MAVNAKCPQCGAGYWFTCDLSGRQVKCDECATTFIVSRTDKKSSRWLIYLTVFGIVVLLLGGVGFVFVVSRYLDRNANEKSATIGVQLIEQCVQDYRVRYDKYPEKLEQLTEVLPDGRPGVLDQKSLIDPWGNLYQYEPTNLHATTKNPRIWSSGQPGARSPISNW